MPTRRQVTIFLTFEQIGLDNVEANSEALPVPIVPSTGATEDISNKQCSFSKCKDSMKK